MATIRVNGTVNGLVHNGDNWMSIATIPDVCKTPTPGGPVPMPYPNISKSSDLSGGTTTVKVDGGNMAAIKGSKFAMSTGDEPGSIGGVKSNTFKQASTWMLYSFDVKLDGQNACRFSDKKFHNNENTVDAMGVLPIVVEVALDEVKMKCGELNKYGEQQKNKSAKGKRHRDHVPSKASLVAAAKRWFGSVSKCQKAAIGKNALSIVIKAVVHQKGSLTYGQSAAKAEERSQNLRDSAKKETKAVEKEIAAKDKACLEAYKKAAKKIRKITNKQYKSWLKKMMDSC